MVRFLKIKKSLGEPFELLSFVHFFHCFEKVKQYENGSNGHLLTYDFFEREEGRAWHRPESLPRPSVKKSRRASADPLREIRVARLL